MRILVLHKKIDSIKTNKKCLHPRRRKRRGCTIFLLDSQILFMK